MNRRISLLLILVTILLIASFSCKRNPVIPPEEEPANCYYPAGNRNYTWRVDTIAWFPSTVGGVWAFSDSDAYVLGTIIDGKPPYESRWGRHWNGNEWENNINAKPGYTDNVGNWVEGDITIAPRNDVTGDDHFMVAVGLWGYSTTTYAGVAEFDNRTKKWKCYKLQAVGELRSVWTDGKGYFVAAGDNGMVYTKDGYMAEWVYRKAPTEYCLSRVTGVSKEEIYISGYQSLATGEVYNQGWKMYRNTWIKLFETKDTSNTPLHLTTSDYFSEMGVWRCDITDSLKIYVIGDQSYLFESKGQQLEFRKTNLSDIGLPLKTNGRTGMRVNVFTPNDIWIIGTQYNFYHWNGENFIKMLVPGLPADDMQFGWQLRLIKTNSGKMFFGSEISSQVYVIYQMTFI